MCVISQGLHVYHPWKIGIAHIIEFVSLHWVHVSVDHFLKFIFASPGRGGVAKHVIAHSLDTFSTLGCRKHLRLRVAQPI